MKIFFLTFFLPTLLFSAQCQEVTPNATHIEITETTLEVNHKKATVFDVRTKDGSRIIRKKQGECFNVVVDNHTTKPTALHWHGFILPCIEDGVPYVTQPPIPPGQSYPYNFPLVQTGTYFAHSHYGLQEQRLMTIPIILLPDQELKEREIVVIVEDFSFEPTEKIWQNLRKDYVQEGKKHTADWIPPFQMRTSDSDATDLNDVEYDAYLANRKTLENPDIFLVEPGEKIRLRLINASTASGFHLFVKNLQSTLIAVDGHSIEPLTLDEFPLATAQRADVIITIPQEGGLFPLLAKAQGTRMQTGVILKTKNTNKSLPPSKTKTVAGAITNALEKKLRATHPLKPKKVSRKLRVGLEGNMKYYTWAINRHLWPNNQSLYVKEGERVEMEFVNNTTMSHPMHLHGHVFQVTEIDGVRFSGAMRDTVLVMPGQTVKVEFDAVHPGIWALHCHIAYHLWAGMFTTLLYEGFTPPFFPKQEIINYSRIYGGYPH